MTQSEIAFTPDVGREMTGQTGMRCIDFVRPEKEDSSVACRPF